MKQRIKVKVKSGYRITEEVLEIIGTLANSLLKQLNEGLFKDSYGILVSGLEMNALYEDVLLPFIINEPPSPLRVGVSSGIFISKERKLVVVSQTLTTDIPNEDKVLYLKVDEGVDDSIILHDIEGVIDYPVYINTVSLVWADVNSQPAGDVIKLGYYDASIGDFKFIKNNVVYRDILVLTSGLIWVGDNSKKVINKDLTPSVEPGISLHRFLACKGSGRRTVRNPFGLTWEDIGGEVSLEHQLSLHSPGVVFYYKGIYSEVYEDFQDKRYLPLYPKIKYDIGVYKIIFCVNKEGNYYVIDDKFVPSGSGDIATNTKGYLLSEGYLRRYILNSEIRLTDQVSSGDYIVYVEYDKDEDIMKISLTDWNSREEDVYAFQRIPICKLVVDWDASEPVKIDFVFNYAYTMLSERVRFRVEECSQRFIFTQDAPWKVDRFTGEEYPYASIGYALGFEFVRRRGVGPVDNTPDYETLKGTFIICDENAELNRETGHFNITQNNIEISCKSNSSPKIKLTDAPEQYSELNSQRLLVKNLSNFLFLDSSKLRFQDLASKRAEIVVGTDSIFSLRVKRTDNDFKEFVVSVKPVSTYDTFELGLNSIIGNTSKYYRMLKVKFSEMDKLGINSVRDFDEVIIKGRNISLKGGLEYIRLSNITKEEFSTIESGLNGVSFYSEADGGYILVCGWKTIDNVNNVRRIYVYLINKNNPSTRYSASVDVSGYVLVGTTKCYYYKVGDKYKILCMVYSQSSSTGRKGFIFVGGYLDAGSLSLFVDHKGFMASVESKNAGFYITRWGNEDKFLVLVCRGEITSQNMDKLDILAQRYEISVGVNGIEVLFCSNLLKEIDYTYSHFYPDVLTLSYVELEKGKDLLLVITCGKSGQNGYIATLVCRCIDLLGGQCGDYVFFEEWPSEVNINFYGYIYSYIFPLQADGKMIRGYLYDYDVINNVITYRKITIMLLEGTNYKIIDEGYVGSVMFRFYNLEKRRGYWDWWVDTNNYARFMIATDYFDEPQSDWIIKRLGWSPFSSHQGVWVEGSKVYLLYYSFLSGKITRVTNDFSGNV